MTDVFKAAEFNWLNEPLMKSRQTELQVSFAFDRRDRMWDIFAWVGDDGVELSEASVKLYNGTVRFFTDQKQVEQYVGPLEFLTWND